jgi:hypothetical protein
MNTESLQLTTVLKKPGPRRTWANILAARARQLEEIQAELINGLLVAQIGIVEGEVRTMGQPPYRRFDCDRRALAYLRVRPKKDFLRLDLGGSWIALPPSRLGLRGSQGVLTLREPEDVPVATELLIQTVVVSRREHERRRALYEQRIDEL